jgi:MoxR-like ATPase
MEEQQVTIDGITYQLESPFMVMATQNPIEQEGTYKLPEAQQDRFLFRVKINYPSLEEEIEIITRFEGDFSQLAIKEVKQVMTSEAIVKCQSLVEKVFIKESLIRYIAEIIHHTRNTKDLVLGASPRASMAIVKTAKALAAIQGRDFVTPDDIQYAAFPVLNHRVILSPEKEMEGFDVQSILQELFLNIEVPR